MGIYCAMLANWVMTVGCQGRSFNPTDSRRIGMSC